MTVKMHCPLRLIALSRPRTVINVIKQRIYFGALLYEVHGADYSSF